MEGWRGGGLEGWRAGGLEALTGAPWKLTPGRDNPGPRLPLKALPMSIQWFPGHMNTTRKAIVERMPEIDVVIELLDARLPGSSANPLLAELTAGKPALKILNKQDLADPAQTALWLAHLQARPGTQALALDAGETAPARRLVAACRALAPLRGGMVKPMRVLICGVPNVGKSTLVNTLRGKRAAKTGDEAGITRLEQRIVLEDDFYLYDTPGMLWPRIAIEQSGQHLAASGAVGRNAYDDEDVALALLTQMLHHHPDRLRARYAIADMAGWNDEAVLAEIGRKRAPLLAGGRPHLQKAAEIAIHDFRSGAWGPVTLETVEEFVGWEEAALARDAEREAKKVARKKKAKPDLRQERGGLKHG
jgi:ribosome biogenesis GTPase A